jgi:hypothetical protein
VLLGNFHSPCSTAKPAVEDFLRLANGREDQAIVKNEIENSLLEFKAFHLVLKKISIQPRTAVYGFMAVHHQLGRSKFDGRLNISESHAHGLLQAP